MNLLPRVAILAIALASSISFAQARTVLYAEDNLVNNLAVAYEQFHSAQGRPPRTWTEIATPFGEPVDKVFPHIQATTRYAFLEDPVPLPLSEEKILILSRSPAHSPHAMNGLLGLIRGNLPSTLERHAVVVLPNGQAYSTTFREPEIQNIFSQAGAALPAPDPLGPRPYETNHRHRLIASIAATLSLIAFLLWLLTRSLLAKIPS